MAQQRREIAHDGLIAIIDEVPFTVTRFTWLDRPKELRNRQFTYLCITKEQYGTLLCPGHTQRDLKQVFMVGDMHSLSTRQRLQISRNAAVSRFNQCCD